MFDSKILGNRMSHDDDALCFQPKPTIYTISTPKWKFFGLIYLERGGCWSGESRGSRDGFGKIEDITMRCSDAMGRNSDAALFEDLINGFH